MTFIKDPFDHDSCEKTAAAKVWQNGKRNVARRWEKESTVVPMTQIVDKALQRRREAAKQPCDPKKRSNSAIIWIAAYGFLATTDQELVSSLLGRSDDYRTGERVTTPPSASRAMELGSSV